MPMTDLQFHHPFRSAAGRPKSFVGTVSIDLAPVDVEAVLSMSLKHGRVDLLAADGILFEEWRAGPPAGEPSDSLPASERGAFERMRQIRAAEWANLRVSGDRILRPVRPDACFAFSSVEGGAAALAYRETGPLDGEIAIPLPIVAEFAYLDPAAELEHADHAALVAIDRAFPVRHVAGNVGFVDAALRTMARGLGSADPTTIHSYADAVSARMRLRDANATDADEIRMWRALDDAIAGMRLVGLPAGGAPAPHAERFAHTVGAEMRSLLPVARLAEVGLAARLPRHPLVLLRRLHEETADWEEALSGERPSLVEARGDAAASLSRLPSGHQTLFADGAPGEGVEDHLDRLAAEARDWAYALSGERPSLDAILALAHDFGTGPVHAPTSAAPR